VSIRAESKELENLFGILKFDERNKKWKHKSEASRKLGMSRPTIDKILRNYPHGLPPKAKLLTPQFVGKYAETQCHKKVAMYYMDRATGKMSAQGQKVDSMGLELYVMFGQVDPLTFSVDLFRKAMADPRFMDKQTSEISFGNLSALRIIMSLAGIDPKRYPEFTTKGVKRAPSKRGWYLEETELIKFIYGIEELDTLVLCRIGFESGGRFSSTSLVSTEKIAFDMNMIEMFEPKLASRGKGIEERYFVNCTMDFIRRYLRDCNVIGRLFKISDSPSHNYAMFEKRLLKAGLNAGLFRYTGQFETREQRRGGKMRSLRFPLTEGKKTSTHLLKHTFVSLASMHGFGLDDVSEQTGTDPDTLKKHYLGVGKRKLKGLILGKLEYVPWYEWVEKTLDPHWRTRYQQLASKRATQ